LNITFLNFST